MTTLSTVALLTLYWAAPSIANHLPHTTWFVVVFFLAAVAILFALQWLARRYDL
jgi:hypothetical protein